MQFDVLIKGGTVVDGSGKEPARRADVGIQGDRIVAVDRLEHASAATTVDATGKVVAPGFVDVHIHSEIELLGGEHRYGGLLQGVTTQLAAPDGFGWSPLDPTHARQLWEHTLFAYGHEGPGGFDFTWRSPEEYLAIFRGNTPANVLPQVPHCAVRLAAMGWEPRPATEGELEAMRGGVRSWMEAGATCLNLGLDYQPSAFSDTRELIELSKVAREYDGIYAAHIRTGDLGEAGGWRETLEIGRESGIPVHISHSRVTTVTGPILEEAPRVCDLTFESYMYPAGCTHLALMLPNWAQAGGPEALRARLRDPAESKRIRDAMHERLTASKGNFARPVFAVTQSGRYIGQSFFDAAGDEPLGDFALRILREEDPYALMVYHHSFTAEEFDGVIADTIRHPKMMVASDGVYHGDYAHPRGYGCFARALRIGVRERRLVSLEEAIYKMAGFPAERFRIRDRGYLRPGYGADVVVFDAETVADGATWEDSRAHPVGIDRVLVNGQTVVEGGKPTGALPGRVLRGGR